MHKNSFKYALDLQQSKALTKLLELTNCYVNAKEYNKVIHSSMTITRRSLATKPSFGWCYTDGQWVKRSNKRARKWQEHHMVIQRREYDPKSPTYLTTYRVYSNRDDCQQDHSPTTSLWVLMIELMEAIQNKEYFKRPSSLKNVPRNVLKYYAYLETLTTTLKNIDTSKA